MSRNGRFKFSILVCCALSSGCNWLVRFFPYELCEVRPVLVELIQETPSNVAETWKFRAKAGCTIVIDVKQGSIFTASSGLTEPYSPISGHEYEVWVEPLEPNGRIDRGVLGVDGRVTILTEVGHTSVTITVYLPNERSEDGVEEERAIVYLDPPDES